MEQRIFIDRFSVPANASQEFIERMRYNRNFLRKLPGFIEDSAYEATDDNGNLLIVTIAVWESNEAIRMAKEAVQAEYKKIGFNMTEFLQRNNILIERGIYSKMSE
jgi:heme-degrading monooxygenase HmoA